MPVGDNARILLRIDHEENIVAALRRLPRTKGWLVLSSYSAHRLFDKRRLGMTIDPLRGPKQPSTQ